MLVTIKINYPTVDDIDGDIASEIIDALTADTVTMTNFWKAHGVTAWVDDVTDSVASS